MTPPSTYLPPDTPIERANGVDAFFMTACAKDPEQRFQSAVAMQRALLNVD